MGLERLCAVLGGFRSNYETDLLRPLIAEVENLTGKTFAPADYTAGSVAVSMRAIADHARAAAFLIADGVFPEKTGREYVLRRIMRRAIYHSWLLGLRSGSHFPRLACMVVDMMGDVFPELRDRRSVIEAITREEESGFRDVLTRGMRMLDDEMGKRPDRVIPGEVAFRLYDTYGFPFDLTRVIATGNQFTVDEAGFEASMEEQRHRAEFVGSGDLAVEGVFQSILDRVGPTKFLGYDTTTAKSEIVAIVAEGKEVPSVAVPCKGPVAVICRETPFYGEQGGQIGDTGTATGPQGALRVIDSKRPLSSLYVHLCEIDRGRIQVGDAVELTVDVERRNAIRRNHSATHLLHWALRTVLGEHVAQKGSLVAPDRLRFDFSHLAPLSPEEKQKVEDLANLRVLRNLAVTTDVLPIAQAKQGGAIAFFGEKYGDTVRVMTMGESKEFCGGTHVNQTGDIGLIKIVEESGVAQGVRRLEAVTGLGALALVRRMESELDEAAAILRAGPFEVAARLEKQQGELRDRDKEISKLKAQIASGGSRDPLANRQQVGKYWLLVHDVGVGDPKILRETADKLKPRMDPGVLVLVGAVEGKVAMVCAVTPAAQDKLNAGKIVNLLLQDLGGKGGGRPDMAQGGAALPTDTALIDIVQRWTEKLRTLVEA
jgi:alanyl-tRNA synthetase